MEFASETSSTTAESEPGGDNFSVEDLLDLSNDDGNLESFTGDSSSPVAGIVESCNSNTTPESCFSAGAGEIGCLAVSDSHIPDGLCIPCDDVAELEWLSNFVEEDSFSKEDLHKLHLISGLVTSTTSGPIKARPDPGSFHSDTDHFASSATTASHPIFNAEVSIPAKARSKRARVVPCNWATQLLALSPNTQPTSYGPEKSLSPNLIQRPGQGLGPRPKKRKGGGEAVIEANGMVRRCLHCDTDRTPQWRTGPKGPKTLCNACGVRYKSGRLVPEYRPAASPTFVQAKHSSSHRKVMELRRQKEAVTMNQQMQSIHHRQQRAMPPEFIHNRMILEVPNPDEYLIHQRVLPDFN